jgi:hypothetical protein
MNLLTRLAYNSSGWQRPTGEASELEGGTFNSHFKFGFEDWFFRGEWQVDGWRYAFLQGANIKDRKYIGRPWNVTLYTIQPDKQRRWVAEVHDLECLDTEQCKDAEAFFREQGWLEQMENEVRAVGGDPSQILNTKYSGHFLNVRYRVDSLEMMPANTSWIPSFWKTLASYYKFYPLSAPARRYLDAVRPRREGRDAPFPETPVFRRAVGAVQYSLEHRRMQAVLFEQLRTAHGTEQVRLEVDGVDILVETAAEVVLYEIKSDLCPRTVIREALGQLLEYAYHPPRAYALPVRLVIVGRCELADEERAYLTHLTTVFHLPVSYRVVNW